MEIILALMALAATPFGAALLDGPTRRRVTKYVKVHVTGPEGKVTEAVRKYQSPVAGVVKAVAPIERRSADHWQADGALQVLWQEAFVFLALKDREAEFKRVLAKMAKDEIDLKPYETRFNVAYEQYMRATSGSFYSRYEYRERMTTAENLLKAEKKGQEYKYHGNEKVIRELALKYKLRSMDEVKYHNDLVRLASGPKLPSLDFVALTAYTGNK
jgi:hypothetical protein